MLESTLDTEITLFERQATYGTFRESGSLYRSSFSRWDEFVTEVLPWLADDPVDAVQVCFTGRVALIEA